LEYLKQSTTLVILDGGSLLQMIRK